MKSMRLFQYGRLKPKYGVPCGHCVRGSNLNETVDLMMSVTGPRGELNVVCSSRHLRSRWHENEISI
jgi:hypothetical protein